MVEIDYEYNEKGEPIEENKDEIESNEENEDENESSEENNENEEENHLCEIFDQKDNKSKKKAGDTKNDIHLDSEDIKGIEVGKTYFIGDIECIHYDKDNLGKHIKELGSLPKYFLKFQKMEEELYDKEKMK